MFEQPAIQRFIALARKESYKARQLIARNCQEGRLYLMLEGTANLTFDHETGQQALLLTLRPGDFFGECALCRDRPVDGMTVRARTPAVVARIEADAFRDLALQHPALALSLIDQLALRLDEARKRMADQFFLDTAERLRRTLKRLSGDPEASHVDGGIAIRINRQELASMIGCSREMVARGLRALESEGRISTSGHDVILLDGAAC